MNVVTGNNNITTGAINLSKAKEIFLENVLRELSPKLTDKQYNEVRVALVYELNKVEILDPLRGYDERLQEENKTILEAYINAKRAKGLSENSIAMYNSEIKNFFKHINDIPCSQISSDVIRDYLDFKLTNGMSAVGVNNIRRVLNAFFNWCFNEDFIIKSPMLRIEKIKETKIVKKAFTESDIFDMRKTLQKRVYESSPGSSSHEQCLRNVAIFELLLSSGIRVGEIVGLTINDMDFRNKCCVVFGKGSKERQVRFNETAKHTIQDYLTQREENHGKLGYAEPLFVGKIRRGKISALTTWGLGRMIRELGLESGIEKAHPHRFRRTFATNMIKKGMSIEKLQLLMGHEDTNTTMIYVNMDRQGVDYEYDKFS